MLLRTGFWLAHYASREPEEDGSGVRHFAELTMAPEPDRVAVVRYQAVLPREPDEHDPPGFLDPPFAYVLKAKKRSR